MAGYCFHEVVVHPVAAVGDVEGEFLRDKISPVAGSFCVRSPACRQPRPTHRLPDVEERFVCELLVLVPGLEELAPGVGPTDEDMGPQQIIYRFDLPDYRLEPVFDSRETDAW